MKEKSKKMWNNCFNYNYSKLYISMCVCLFCAKFF